MKEYYMSFIVGGCMCVIAQILMDRTKLTPARILVSFVTIGVLLGAFNIYDYFIKYGSAGATIPLPGFGNSLVKSTIREIDDKGFIGVFTGGIKGAAGGISAAIIFGYIMALLFKPKTKG